MRRASGLEGVVMTDAETIAILRVELAETIEQRDELAQRNQALLESQRRVYVATRPVLDAVKELREAKDHGELLSAVANVCAAYNTYNPPRELEVYK